MKLGCSGPRLLYGLVQRQSQMLLVPKDCKLVAQSVRGRVKTLKSRKMVRQKSFAAIEKPLTGRMWPKIFSDSFFIRVLTRPREGGDHHLSIAQRPEGPAQIVARLRRSSN